MHVECLSHLVKAGIDFRDAVKLLRIARTLDRWNEATSGDEFGAIEYDEVTGKPYWRSAITGACRPIPDRETGAKKRLATIMAKYPSLSAHVQGDPRGASVYILRPGDVPEGADIDACLSRGIGVCE